MRRLVSAVQLQVDDRPAALRQCVMETAILRVQSSEQLLNPFVPFGCGRRQWARSNYALEARMGGEHEEVAKLQTRAEYPEARIHQSEESEGAKPDPVRRHEHPEWTGVE